MIQITVYEGGAAREPLWREVVGDCLRDARHDRDETLGETAARAGVSPQYLSEIERGLKEPSSEVVAAVARALGLTLVDLTEEVSRSLGVGSVASVRNEVGATASGTSARMDAVHLLAA